MPGKNTMSIGGVILLDQLHRVGGAIRGGDETVKRCVAQTTLVCVECRRVGSAGSELVATREQHRVAIGDWAKPYGRRRRR